MGDQEAYQFAEEIKEYLENEGYTFNKEVHQTIFVPPIKGQKIRFKEDGSIEIIIGSN